MRGHESIISMRLGGFKPRSVWLSLIPVHECLADWAKQGLPDAEVLLAPEDVAGLARLDLRFLVGLPVYATGPNDETTTYAANLCLEAGATHVTAIYTDPSRPAWDSVMRISEHKPNEGETWLL